MAVEIDGSLNWSAGIDFSDIEKQAQELSRKIVESSDKAISDIEAMVDKASLTFEKLAAPKIDNGPVIELTSAIKSLTESVLILEDTFGSQKLEALNTQLSEAKDTAEEFNTVLDFVADNAQDITLDVQGAEEVKETVQAIKTALDETAGSAVSAEVAIGGFDESFSGAVESAGLLHGQIRNLESELDALEAQMAATTDKTILDQLNQQSKQMYAQLDFLQAKFRSLRDSNFGDVSKSPLSLDIDKASKKDLEQYLKSLTDYGDKLRQAISFSETDEEVKSLNDNLEQTQGKIGEVNDRLEQMGQKTVTLNAQLRQVKDQLANMQPSDEGYQELIDKAAELENNIRNVNKEVKLAGSNTAGLQALKQGLNGLVGGFGAAASAMALFSGDQDKMQQTMTKLFLVIQTVSGAEQLLATVNKNSAVVQYALNLARRAGLITTVSQGAATGALAAAETVEATAATAAASAQWSLNAAIAANPIGAAITAITVAVGAIALYAANTEDALEAQTKMNEALSEANKTYAELVELQGKAYSDRTKSTADDVVLAQSTGKASREVLDLQIKANEAARLEAVYKLESLGYDKQRIGYDRAKLESITQQIRYLESIPNDDLDKAQKKQLENLKSQESVIKSLYDSAVGYLTTIEGANSRNAQLLAEQAKQLRERALTSATAEAEARAIVAKKGTEEELKAQEAAINARRRQELANVELTEGERKRINAQAEKDLEYLRREFRQKRLSDEEALAKATLATAKNGSIEEFNAKLTLINLSAQRELEVEGITAARVKQIEAEKLKEIFDLNRQYTFDRSEEDISRKIAEINQRLAVVRSGSEEEFQLRLDLINQTQALEIAKAQSSIQNETKLATAIQEINTKSLKERYKAEDDYIKRNLDARVNAINYEAEQQILAFQKVANDPSTTRLKQLRAQSDIVGVDIETTKKEITAIKDAISQSKGDVSEYIKKLQELRLELQKLGVDQAIVNKEIKNTAYEQIGGAIQNISGAIGGLSNSLRGINDDLADTTAGFGQLASSIGTVVSSIGKEFSTGDQISGIVNGVIQLTSMVIEAAAQRKMAEEQFYNSIANQQRQYNLALQEAILLNGKLKDNVFLVDYKRQLKDGIDATINAQKEFNKALEELQEGQAKAGQRNAIGWGNVLKGAAIGAYLGTVVPGVGNVIGAVVGGVAGAIVGLFGGKKKKDVYVSLLDEYPELLEKTADGVVNVNRKLAESLVANNLVSESTKGLINDVLAWQDAIDKANEQIRQIITDLSGSLGDDLRNALVTAFQDGTDSAVAFAQSVEKTLNNMLSQLLFAQVFGSAFDSLEKRMKESFGMNGDKNWSDDLLDFFQDYSGLADDFNEQLQKARDEAEKYGLNLFQNPNAQSGGNSLAGAIKGITEQQADLLAGQFGGLRITAMQQLQVMNNSLIVFNKIETNTANLIEMRSILRNINNNGVKLIK